MFKDVGVLRTTPLKVCDG